MLSMQSVVTIGGNASNMAQTVRPISTTRVTELGEGQRIEEEDKKVETVTPVSL